MNTKYMKRINPIYQKENVRVLIAVEDPVEMSSLEYLIAGHGFDYRKEDNPVKALKTARVYKPDLIIIDVIKPHFDGLEVARKIKNYKKYNNTRFIFLTESLVLLDKKNPVFSLEDFYIMRPLNIENISRKINTMFEF